MTQRLIALARFLAFITLTAGLIGFGAFAGQVSNWAEPDDLSRADAVIVLTGDAGRLNTGARLLSEGAAPLLLVSGVHREVTAEQLRRASGLDAARFECCVSIGRDAADTVGNARETAAWARAGGHDTLIIVTSDYHLPRSLAEMRARLPEAELIAYPVRTAPPWRSAAAARVWLLEYAKYVTVLARNAFNGASAAMAPGLAAGSEGRNS